VESYEVTHETIDGARVVRVKGKLDRDAGAVIEEVLGAHSGPCVLNLEGVEYISSTGVASLVKLTSNRSAQIACPPDCVTDVLSLAGVTKILSIHGDERAAIEASRA